MPPSAETLVTLGKLVLYGVNPLTWGTAFETAIEGVASKVEQALRDRANARRMLLGEPERRPGPGDAPSLFLREEYEVVDFAGRADELARLSDWARVRDPRVSVALVTGGPGRGKSRLVRRLCRIAMSGDWSDPWFAGRLEARSPDDDTMLVGHSHFLPLMKLPGPLLLVLDYAEQRWPQVEAVARAALEAAAERGGHQVRLLLVAREKGEWWERLAGRLQNDIEDPFRPSRLLEIALVPLDADPGIERVAEFARAWRAFRTALGLGADGPPPVPADIGRIVYAEALDLHLAALLAAYGDMPQPGATEEDLLRALVRREQRSWDAALDIAGRDLKGLPIRRAVSWLGATDALADEAAASARLRLLPEFSDADEGRRRSVTRVIASVYPPSDSATWWVGFRPDRLATFQLSALTPEDVCAVGDLPAAALTNLVRHLNWYARRYGHDQVDQLLDPILSASIVPALRAVIEVALETGDPIGRIAAVWLTEHPDLDLAATIDDEIPYPTTVLRELGEAVARLRLTSTHGDDVAAVAERARLMNRLSNRLYDLGRREAALAAVEEAVALYHDLAETQPDTFRPNLAMSLNNQSNCLSDLGRLEAALAVAEEAVALYRDLAETQPDTIQPDLAMALNNLSVHLSSLGRREVALVAIEEAVALFRELAATRPNTFRPDLAGSLNNQSNCLFSLGRREAALAVGEEMVSLYRDLAATRSDAFGPDLAGSLDNLSNYLSGLGRREPALAAVEEAVALYRELAATRPDTFRPDLAGSLNNLSNHLSDLGRREAALAAVDEAVTIRRELAAARPDAFRPDLAISLNNLSNRLSNLGRHKAALAAGEEAVTLYRNLAAARPDAFRSNLAMSLNNLAIRLSNFGQSGAALAVVEEAVALYRDLAAARPNAFRPDLASSLHSLSNCLSGLAQHEAALPAVEEAVAIHRDLAAASPDAFRPRLAVTCGNRGTILGNLGELRGARDSFREGVVALSSGFLSLPQAHVSHMMALVRAYLVTCETTDFEPDTVLLGPILDILVEIGAMEPGSNTTANP